ncbi:MucBP domain-containing protein [Streptococcus mitis]|uniref:MucBP domain-containing protein n=1 Tax=Streptococcus mitis TaxID=28037 RepID=UPI0020015B93|nr:MucBP domain-containing protein [Streptococcus mitis]
MFINKKEKFSIRKFKDGRSDSVKIGTVGLIVGAALAMAGQPHIAEAAMTENSDNTTTISNDKGSVIVDTANIENPDAGRAFSTDPTAEGTNTITKTGKVDYKYVTAEGNTVLEENKNQNSGADKTIETTYDVYGKSGEVFKGTTGGDAEDSDLNDAKENGKKETIEKDGKTYHLIGEPKVETTGDGGGVYSDTTLGDVTAKLTPEGLSNAEGKITYDTVKAGGKAWIVEQTGKGTYGKYVQADSGAITSDDKMVEAFKAGEAAAKDFNSANVTADGGIKEGDYVFVLEKNTYVTANTESQALTGSIPLSSSDNVADDVDGTGATLNRTYAMVQKFKAAPDTLTGVENKTLVKGYLAYLQGKGLEDNLLNFKRYVSIGLAGIAEDQVDAKGRPTRDLTADTSSVSDSDTLELEDGGFLLRLNAPSLDVEEYSYRDEITPLRAYRVASGTTTITYTYAEEKTREVEKKGSVVVNYQTTDGVELKAPYTDTPETVAEVVTEHYYVNADGQEVVLEDKTVRTPKNVTYNTKENETEKPQKLTDAAGNVYYLNEANTKTALNDQETTSPAETGTVVEGVTKVTYIYEKAGSVIVNYQTEDGTPLVGTADGKDVVSGAKDTDNGKPGSEYNTADNGMKPNRITTADGKVYELVPASTKGDETGTVASGQTKEVTYVYKEVKGNVVVKYEDAEGNVIAEDEKDETDASLNVKYDTAEHKKDEITKDGVKYYLTAKELKDGSKPTTGDVVEGTTTVTYVYEKAGQVVVNYQTEDGSPLVGTADGKDVVSGAKDTVDGRPGSDYNTADNGMKPTRITTAEGKVYELVPASTKGEETGKVATGETKEVTYVYKEVTGDVVVHYVDAEGNVIAEDKEDTKGASLNAKYDTTDNKPEKIEKDGTVYYLTEKALKDDSKPENGDVVEGKTEVTYVYEKAGQVVVNYTDEKGNTIQVSAVATKDGKPGTAYNTSDNGMKPNRITTPEGKVYELIPQSTKGDETGKVKAGETTEVTYVYKEITGNVVVHYVDTEGNTLAADTKDVENGSLSEKYDTTDNKPEKIEKDGTVYYLTAKELKEGSKPENGAVVEGTTEISYVYEKAGQVVVHYVDEAGNTLQADAVDTKDGKPGAKYDTSDKDMKPTRITTPEGKVYELVPASTKGNEIGDVEAGKTTEVTYVYKEVKGNVVVHYVDEAGNTIAEDVKDTTDGSISSAYDTTDNKLATITTKDGKKYALVPTATKGSENGKVTEGTVEVTYVYKEVTGDVVVHYVDTEGNVIADDKEDTKGASLNAKYDTTDNKLEKIEKDGTVYYITKAGLKDDSKPETGNVVEGETEVTYVYEKAGQVVVHYVDETGNTIQTDAVDTKDGKPGAAYNTTDNDLKPTRITTAEGKVYELVPASTKGNENGSVETGKTTEVTYVYKEVKGNVVVHYVDEAGNTIAEDVKDTTEGSISSAYDTTDNKLATITTKDGKKYALVPTATKGSEKGKVTEGTTEVTYVYKEVKEDSTNGGSPTPSQPGSPARPSTNPVRPTDPSQPETPVVPADPSQPANPANPANPAGPATPAMPSAPVNGEAPQAPAAPSEAKGQAELPNTGTADNASLAALGLLGVLSGFGLVARKKKED